MVVKDVHSRTFFQPKLADESAKPRYNGVQ